MTTEEPISVPEAVAVEPTATAPKKRLKQPSRPDEAEYKSQTEALQQSSAWGWHGGGERRRRASCPLTWILRHVG